MTLVRNPGKARLRTGAGESYKAAAVREGNVADIFREVDEEVRAERAKQLWRKYGALVIGAAVLAVVAVGGVQFWGHMQAEAAAEASLRLEEAAALSGQDKPADAAAAFAALAAEGGGAGLLARFGEAAELARQGDVEAAIARYEALAADEDAAPVYRDLARLFRGWRNWMPAGPKRRFRRWKALRARSAILRPRR